MPALDIRSPNTRIENGHRYSTYVYHDTLVATDPATGQLVVTPYASTYNFDIDLKVPRTGLMLVGWGGNNGSTLTAALCAHSQNISWATRRGMQKPNYFGSLVLASTLRLGRSADGSPIYAPFSSFLPLINPVELVLGGWDISSANMAQAAERAQVLEPDMLRQLKDTLSTMVPLPAAFDPNFVAGNQAARADNLITGNKSDQLNTLRSQIRDFKENNNLEKVIVLWTANTERFSDSLPSSSLVGEEAADALLADISSNHTEVAPSVLYAVASILEGCPFINGSPQNTLTSGIVGLAVRHNVPIAGDDFKSGQTKLKSVLTDFLVGAGIKPLAITSYNHLGNNDGLNLSAPSQFRSKEISKKGVVDDVVISNSILYAEGEMPDHVVVIKYVPAVGDSKRALDEYEAEIFCGGRQTISLHVTCEDSLLATPLILDLVLLADLLGRVRVQKDCEDFLPLHPVLSHLAYCLKAPEFPPGTAVVHALAQQRQAIENFLRALLALPPNTNMSLEDRLSTGR